MTIASNLVHLAGDLPPTRYVVTHADYRALEEEVIELRKSVGQDTDTITRLEEELSALRVRVGEICDARDRLVEAKDRLRKVIARRKLGSRPQLQENTDEAERDFWVVMGALK